MSTNCFNIYLCSTRAYLDSIRQVAQNESIILIELNLTPLPGLPAEHHTTNGLPSHLMATLKRAFDNASPKFEKILKGNAFSYKAIYYRAYEYWSVKEVLKSEANGHKDKDRVIEGVKNSSSIVLAKSFKEIEVMEATKFGVPINAMPMHLDQPVNARLFVELGLGKEVLRDGNCVLSGHKVA
nr:hypothetical protein [Tanacetum cinerariifolium]